MSHGLGTDFQGVQATEARNVVYRDLDADFAGVFEACRRYTMLSVEALFDLYKSCEYLARSGIPGAILECGVWEGGAMLLAAATLQKHRAPRPIYLFDTFTGHPDVMGPEDKNIWGRQASFVPDTAIADEDAVRARFTEFYPPELTHIIKGRIEDTLEANLPDRIALARLDTDWYAPTKLSLELCWPRIVPGGFLVIDDYGAWQGARRACDDYFRDKPVKLTRIDYSCRVVQKHPE